MLFRLIKNVILFNKRMAEVKSIQSREGYSIEMSGTGPETYWTYTEDGREIAVGADFTLWNDVTLYTDSLRKWSEPYGTDVSEFDYQKILDRCIRYFSCWGQVTLDDTILPSIEDIKNSLSKQGVEFAELENGVIHYKMDADKFREQQMPNRK